MAAGDRIATVLAGLTGLIGWVALAIEFERSISASLAKGRGLAEALFLFFRYFSILSNIGVAALMALTALRLVRHRRLFPPVIFNAALAYILVTGVTYEVLLRHQWRPQGLQFATDFVIHDIVPVLMLAFWLAFAPRAGARWWDALWVLAFPAAYLAMTLVAGALGEGYPYDFIDVDRLGYARVLVTAAVFLAIFYGLGQITAAFARARSVSSH